MGRKAKYNAEQKEQACEDYLTGKKSAIQIARELGMSKRGSDKVLEWARSYRINGAEIFKDKPHNRSYTKEFKNKIVMEYQIGQESLRDLQIKYNIPSTETIRKWILKYNNHIEIKDYDPKPEVYMAKSRKTTYEERIEIVKYCLDHDRDIKITASLYKCSYHQVRSWVLKYEEDGEEGRQGVYRSPYLGGKD